MDGTRDGVGPEADDRPMVTWTLFRRSQQAQSEGNGAKVVSLAEAVWHMPGCRSR
jgi:hypothetical protein